MNLRTLAKMIPDSVRSTRLLTDADPISNATAAQGDQQFQLLWAVWFEFIEAHKKEEADLGCPYCRQNVLSNFKAMKDVLLQLEREYQLIKSLKQSNGLYL